MTLAEDAHKLDMLHVRFEQGRGLTGVPRAWIALTMTTNLAAIETVVKIAVAHMRAICADPTWGHGQDLMPGRDDEYQLHNAVGGRATAYGEIRFEPMQGGGRLAEMVLTWRTPSILLAGERAPASPEIPGSTGTGDPVA